MSPSAITVRHLSAPDVHALVTDSGVTLVDVREPNEHAAERIPGAVLMPLSRFDPHALPPGELIFHCGSGKRSQAAIDRCRAARLTHAAHLAGGIAAWKQAGLPTERG